MLSYMFASYSNRLRSSSFKFIKIIIELNVVSQCFSTYLQKFIGCSLSISITVLQSYTSHSFSVDFPHFCRFTASPSRVERRNVEFLMLLFSIKSHEFSKWRPPASLQALYRCTACWRKPSKFPGLCWIISHPPFEVTPKSQLRSLFQCEGDVADHMSPILNCPSHFIPLHAVN